jgi:nickel/cobalt exporter
MLHALGRDAMTMHHSTRHRRLFRGLAALAAVCALLALPAIVAAHPLGNFTINHYAGVRVESDRVLLDVVVDQAEIPTFQARLGFDTDGDGEVSDAETDAGRVTACESLAPDLTLTVDGARRPLVLDEAGLTFPSGVGGLNTMRIVCAFSVSLGAPLAAGARIDFADTSFADRLGWREIVATGSGVTLAAPRDAAPLRVQSTSDRLRTYPTDLLTQALADKAVAILVTPGGPTLPALDIADASPIAESGADRAAVASVAPRAPAAAAPPVVVAAPAIASAGSVPGGVTGADLPSILRSTDISPIVLLVSILTAAALGAGHALTPGHGKTLMAAYLVGTRGTPLHAAGLGLSVTFSHTLGILVLAAVVVGAQGFLPPDTVVRWAPVVAAVSIVAIGGWMLFGEARRRWRAREGAAAGPEHDHGRDGDRDHDHDGGTRPGHDAPAGVAGEHGHGGVTHSHLPPAGTTISWRSLFVLGLAGGLIPSTSALLILLGSIAAGRPAFGFVLVVAFGLGMALVMGGIGLALVLARGRLDRVDAGSPLGRASGLVPLAAAVLVFGLGLYLTVQAVAGTTTF